MQEEKRTIQVGLLMTKSEKAYGEKQAKKYGMSMGAFIRMMFLQGEVKIKVETSKK